MKLYDQNGDECQMTGLPHMFYDKVAVEDLVRVKDARIAELEKALREIAELDYANAATNGAAYDAVRIAKSVL